MLIRFSGPVRGTVEETGETYITDVDRDYEPRNLHLLVDGGVFAQLETYLGLVNIACGRFIWKIGGDDGVTDWTPKEVDIPAGVDSANPPESSISIPPQSYPNNYPRL